MKTTLFFMTSLLGSMSFLQICNGQIPPLGTTSTFAVFTAAGAINNISPTTVTGDLGTNVGAYNGFPPGIVLGGARGIAILWRSRCPEEI